MKNKEFYFDEIVKCFCSNNGCSLTKKILKIDNCNDISCKQCEQMITEALEQEYVLDINWAKVPKDTLVLVSDFEQNLEPENAIKLYFYKYEPHNINMFTCYDNGATSETYKKINSWKYCRLAKEEDVKKYSW